MTEHDPRAGGRPPDPATGRTEPDRPADTADRTAAPAPAGPRAAPSAAGAPTAPLSPPARSAATDPASPDAPTAEWTPPPERAEGPGVPPTAEPVGRRSGSRARWGIALLVTALIVAVGIGVFMLVSGQRTSSAVAGYVPDQAVVYGELRLDLPGDQRQKLGQFLSKFPGFRDQSTLDVKLDDVLDRLIRGMTSDQQDWTTKIEPWFAGQLGISIGSLPTAPSAPSLSTPDVRWLVTATVKDAAGAHAWLESVVAQAGAPPLQTETHRDVEIHLGGTGDLPTAVAYPDGKVMLVGDEATVRSAIETGGNGPFAGSDRFRAASGGLEGDHLAYFYVDTAQYLAWTREVAGQFGGGAIPMTGFTEALTPEWLVVQLQARGDALALETVMPRSPISPDANRAGAIAGHVPASTLFLSDAHDYGATILEVLALLRAEPELREVFVQVDQYLGFLGGEDGLFGWMGDAGIAIARDGDGIHGGLVFTVTDRARAERLLTTLESFASVGGSSAGITLRNEDHDGSRITIVDAGDFAELMSRSGTPLPPGMALPEGRAELAWTVTDDVLVFGVGSSFVRAVLDAGDGPSLAEDARYQAHLAQVGAENLGAGWIDVAGIRELVEKLGALDPQSFAIYERDLKPYLVPLDAAVGGNVRDGELDRSTFIVTVK